MYDDEGKPQLTTDEIINGLAAVVVAGVLAQWLAWRFKLPSILLLLFFGLLAGPVTGILDPDALIGADLIPLVSISVAIILFEGGLSLNFRELRGLQGPVIGLISVGAITTWVLIGLAIWYILGINEPVAILLGAILIVSGPTVVQPLLLHIRPTEKVGSVLKWEGIFIDPIGAIAAVVTVHIITTGIDKPSVFGLEVVGGVAMTLVVGGVIGAVSAFGLAALMRNYRIPDFLLNSVTLALVVGVFAFSDAVRSESGLFATTIMGVVLANQQWVSVREIVEFKENLRVLIISLLFILLSARLTRDEIQAVLSWQSFVFLAVLVLMIRPAAAALSTLRSNLNLRERGFIAWMAPRGIVAASTASIFGLQLQDLGVEDANLIVPFSFFVIITTVIIYGVTAGPVAGLLGVKGPEPVGVLFYGINPVSRGLATELQNQKIPILLVDTNQEAVQEAGDDGLPTYHGDILVEETVFTIDFSGIGKLAAMTPNDDINSLAVLSMREVFDRKDLFRVPPEQQEHVDMEAPSKLDVPGRILAGDSATLLDLTEQLENGATIRSTKMTADFGFREYQNEHRTIPFFTVDRTGKTWVFAPDETRMPASGDTVIGIVNPDDQPQISPATKDREISSFGERQESLDGQADKRPATSEDLEWG